MNDDVSIIVDYDELTSTTSDFMDLILIERLYFLELCKHSLLTFDAVDAVLECFDIDLANHGVINMYTFLNDGYGMDDLRNIKHILGETLTAVQQLRHALTQLPTDSKLEETIAKIDTYIVVLRDYNKRFREIIAAGYLYSDF